MSKSERMQKIILEEAHITLSGLVTGLREQLAEYVVEGMKLPFVVCCASHNGSVYCCRMDGEKPPALLVEHFEPEGFALPVIVTVIDQDSEYRGLTIDVDKIKGPH